MAWALDPAHSLMRNEDVTGTPGWRVWTWNCPECPPGMTFTRLHVDGDAPVPSSEAVTRHLAVMATKHLLEHHRGVPYVRREVQRQQREVRIAKWWAKAEGK